MTKRITFRHMEHEHSDALESHINKQLEKIEHFLEKEPQPVMIDFMLLPSKTRAHPSVELRVKTPHYDRIVHEDQNGKDMYEIIDTTIDRMYRLLHEDKQKAVDNLRRRTKFEKINPDESQTFDDSQDLADVDDLENMDDTDDSE